MNTNFFELYEFEFCVREKGKDCIGGLFFFGIFVHNPDEKDIAVTKTALSVGVLSSSTYAQCRWNGYVLVLERQCAQNAHKTLLLQKIIIRFIY